MPIVGGNNMIYMDFRREQALFYYICSGNIRQRNYALAFPRMVDTQGRNLLSLPQIASQSSLQLRGVSWLHC